MWVEWVQNGRCQPVEEAPGCHLVGSGGPPLVAVMQSADSRDSDDSPGRWRLDRSRLRAVLFERQVCPAAMVILNESSEVLAQTSFTEHAM
jgi:hypothetical protein